jgi:hypothetical protein
MQLGLYFYDNSVVEIQKYQAMRVANMKLQMLTKCIWTKEKVGFLSEERHGWILEHLTADASWTICSGY